jgi:hypothetical protein
MTQIPQPPGAERAAVTTHPTRVNAVDMSG